MVNLFCFSTREKSDSRNLNPLQASKQAEVAQHASLCSQSKSIK